MNKVSPKKHPRVENEVPTDIIEEIIFNHPTHFSPSSAYYASIKT